MIAYLYLFPSALWESDKDQSMCEKTTYVIKAGGVCLFRTLSFGRSLPSRWLPIAVNEIQAWGRPSAYDINSLRDWLTHIYIFQ